MIHLDNWEKKEIQEKANALMMKLHAGYLGFIENKLGKDAIIECISDMAKKESEVLNKKESKEKGALKVAINQGTIDKNICGCENVVAQGNENHAILSIGRCTSLMSVRKLIESGQQSMTEEICCAGCRAYYSALAKFMGIKNTDFVKTSEGCKYIYSIEDSK